MGLEGVEGWIVLASPEALTQLHSIGSLYHQRLLLVSKQIQTWLEPLHPPPRCKMTQDELWLAKWQEAIDFLETNHRKPSKFIPEERNLRSWWKHNKKLMNAGELKPERVAMFEQLLELGEKYRHVNQYQ